MNYDQAQFDILTRKNVELLQAIKDTKACFDADIEGLQQILVESTDERLRDLIRRLSYADRFACEALEKNSS